MVKFYMFVALKVFRTLLLPMAWIYGAILALRNLLFNIGILKTYQSNVLTIGVGNLSVGGTGKTPFIKLLMTLFEDKKVAIVSRGYGRKTKGLIQLSMDSLAAEVGDEPLLLKHIDNQVWVCEHRIEGVKAAEKWGAEIILLDDNFQHRYVKPHFQLMLSKFNAPFFKDWVLPAGNLREFRKGAKRADIIVFTHTPDLNAEAIYTTNAKKYTNAKVLFAQHQNQPLHWVFGEQLQNVNGLIVSGLANATAFETAAKAFCINSLAMRYSDHYAYQQKDILEMLQKMKDNNLSSIICTEKDWVKLKEFTSLFQGISIATLPVAIKLLSDVNLKRLILDAIKE